MISECLGLHKFCGKFKKINSPLRGVENLSKISKVQALSSAVIFRTKKYLQRLGGFDESYLSGVEDLDLSMRIKINGDKIAFIKNLAAKHLLSDSRNELLEVYKAWGFVVYIKKFSSKLNNIILASCLKILISLRYILNVYSMQKIQKKITTQ